MVESCKLLNKLLRDLVVVTLCWEGKTLKNITSPGVWLEQGENGRVKLVKKIVMGRWSLAWTTAAVPTILVYCSRLTLVYVNRIIKLLIHMNAITSSNKMLN